MIFPRAAPASLGVLETFVSPVPGEGIVTARDASEALLAELGIQQERGPDVGLIMRMLEGCETRGGYPRQMRLEHCGVAYPVLVDGQLFWTRRGCKDRFCPDCGDAAGTALAGKVERHCARRNTVVLGINYTQIKREREEPRQAVDRALGSWRKVAVADNATGLFRKPRARSKVARPPALPGGLRILEVTAHPADTVIGTHTVRFGGIHAHIHALAESRPGEDLEELGARLKAAWLAASPEAEEVAQVIRPLSGELLRRAIAYASSLGPLARLIDVAPVYARSVVMALAGRKLIEPWGTWRGKFCGGCGTCGTCRRNGVERESTVKFGDRPIFSVMMQPGGVVRFGDDVVWQASDVAALMMTRPKQWPERN